MPRPLTDHDAMRRRLVAHGRALLAEGGTARLVLAEIARREGLSTPALYHYFASRRALVLAVLEAEVVELLAIWDPGAASDHDPSNAAEVARFLDAQARYLSSTPPAVVAFLLGAVLGHEGDDAVARIVAPVFGRAEALFRAFAHEVAGELVEPPDVVADLLRATIGGLFLLRALAADIDASAIGRALAAHLPGLEGLSKSL